MRRTLAAILGLGGATFGLDVALRGAAALDPVTAAHGALMLVAWGIMAPGGAVIARYFKVTPRQDFPAEVDNPFWWNWHRGLQYGGLALSSLAGGLMLWASAGRVATLHGACGLAVLAVGWGQVVAALLRGSKGGMTDRRAAPADPATWRGDHYDMTRRRLIFEAWHKRAGWAVIALAAVTIVLGVGLVGAPAWLVGLVGVLQGAVLFAVVDGRLRGRWVDTYVALWGPDPVHPGNRGRVRDDARRPRGPR